MNFLSYDLKKIKLNVYKGQLENMYVQYIMKHSFNQNPKSLFYETRKKFDTIDFCVSLLDPLSYLILDICHTMINFFSIC